MLNTLRSQPYQNVPFIYSEQGKDEKSVQAPVDLEAGKKEVLIKQLRWAIIPLCPFICKLFLYGKMDGI